MGQFDINPFTKKLDLTGFTNQAQGFVDTVDDTLTPIVAIKVLEKQVVQVTADIVGVKDDGSERACYKLNALFYRNLAGDVTQQSTTWSLNTIESDNTWDINIVANTVDQTIDVKVLGVAGTNIKWKAVVNYNVIGY